MSGISISIVELTIKGIPEGLLLILALHLFTKTKIESKKYFILSGSYIVITYLIRMLPIQLGINTMLSILTLVLLYQLAYRGQLEKLARLVASAVVILILIMIAEALNIFLLEMIFGVEKTLQLLSSGNGLMKSISTIPSTIFTAVFILAVNALMKKLERRKKGNGEIGSSAGG